MDHPYRGIPETQQWYRAVTWVEPGQLDPIVAPRFRVTASDRVATMGSCFAQHIARRIVALGMHYLVTEPAPAHLVGQSAALRQYGTFSARYGNVYTVEQACQLVRRAYGDFVPSETAWHRPDGAVADPFRPTIEPDGFPDFEQLVADRASHLAAVRDVVERADVLVFTLGLTEHWQATVDGAAFPVAPGVVAGTYDPDRYRFVNSSIDDVRSGLRWFCATLRHLNPRINILLTVSPVPLVATYESRHVLVSTVYSKSVLRIAAEEIRSEFDFVDYFPSYEIISAASATRNYFDDDLREVTELGVDHVMRMFARHYVAGSVSPASRTHGPAHRRDQRNVICDEDVIQAAIEATR